MADSKATHCFFWVRHGVAKPASAPRSAISHLQQHGDVQVREGNLNFWDDRSRATGRSVIFYYPLVN